MDVGDLVKEFEKVRESNRRKAAEMAYVLAKLHLDAGELEKAAEYGRESIRLFDQCRMETLEDCAAQLVTLSGVALPSLIHQDVVRDRLKALRI